MAGEAAEERRKGRRSGGKARKKNEREMEEKGRKGKVAEDSNERSLIRMNRIHTSQGDSTSI